MIKYNTIIKRAKELIHDPIFKKPIQVIDYSKGEVKCITKIINYER